MEVKQNIITWSDDLSTGIEWQDTQHKTLVDQINKLGANEGTLEDIFEFTKHYTATHFRDEEAIMIHYNYPRLNEHIEEHSFFISSIEKLDITLKSDTEVRRELLVELSSWLIWHIKNSDFEQIKWLNEHSDITNHQPAEFYSELEVYRRETQTP